MTWGQGLSRIEDKAPNKTSKQELSEEIQRHIEAFLDSGGKIEFIQSSFSATPKARMNGISGYSDML